MAMKNDKAIDPDMYLVGRERNYDSKVMGRQPGDAERLFPRYTHASAATAGEVTINGKVIKLWEFSQLETLSAAVLKQRALAIRDALGEASCPPMPSAQPQDLVRWILHVQDTLTKQEAKEGRSGGYGTGHFVPKSFAQDTKARPIGTKDEAPASPSKKVFGRSPDPGHEAMRDHYNDLKYNRAEFEEDPNQGIQTNRQGGEGRRHLFPTQHMSGVGTSECQPRGMTTLRENGEGRRFLTCNDHIMEQQKELEAMQQGVKPASLAPRERFGEEVRHVSDTSMTHLGVSAPNEEAPIGGERRRHTNQPDHMLNHGISADAEDGGSGRKYLDSFAGSRTRFSDTTNSYQSTWKKDPSRLLGTSLIC